MYQIQINTFKKKVKNILKLHDEITLKTMKYLNETKTIIL